MRRESGADTRTLELTFRERAAPAGSPHSFALLFADGDLRAPLAALFAFEAELRGVVHPAREHGAAHLKLAWWSEEIERIARGAPQHPIGRALVAAAAPLMVDLGALRDTLVAAQHDLARRGVADLDELLAYCHRSSGIGHQLAAAFAEPAADRHSAVRRFGGALGRGLRLTELLAQHRVDIEAGRVRLPQTLLQRHGLTGADFLKPAPGTGALGLLDELAAGAHALLGEAIAFRDIDRRRQRAGLVLAEMAGAALARMRREQFSVRSLGTLSSFRLLWCAWRRARNP